MNFQFARDIFHNEAFARRIGHDEMDRRDKAHVLLNDLADKHAFRGVSRFLNVGAGAKQIRGDFPWCERLTGVLRFHVLVLGESGKVK